MTTAIEYALMAGASYVSTRSDANKFPVPQGWTAFAHVPNNPDYPMFTSNSGFEAVAFKNGSEIVISYAGTYPGSLLGATNLLGIPVDLVADAGLGLGFGSDQLLQAVRYYLDVRAANPNTPITLTGHSLGGGLASLVSVFFGVSATTFDQAPFANSAQAHSLFNPFDLTPDVAVVLKKDLSALLDSHGNRLYTDAALSSLDYFLLLRAADGGIPDANLVNNIRVDGEFLSSLPIGVYSTIGNTAASNIITHGVYNSPSMELHSQALLTTFLQSQQAVANTAESTHTLSEVSKKLPDLLGMIFNPNLYAFDTDKSKVNLLEHLVRHQVGGVDGVQSGGDQMVTRLTADLWKLAQDGGLTRTDQNPNPALNELSKALIAFAMQFYYEQNNPNTTYGKELFSLVNGGITFDLHDVSQAVATAMDSPDPSVKVDLTAAKGYQYLQAYLAQPSLFTPAEHTLIQTLLPTLRDWYVQAGSSGMNATDTQNRGAFMLGGSQADALVGGTANDLLVGNAGDDVLQGGGGSDVLMGGKGNDSYVYTTGNGLDLVLDSDGLGSVVMDGAAANDASQLTWRIAA